MQPQQEVVFEREDWTHFRTINGCAMMAGVSADCLARVAVKEVTDNALDVHPSCEIGMLDDGGFYVHDAGPGMPGDDLAIAERFSVGRSMVSTKMKRLPTMGALGNGLRVVAGAVLASAGTLKVHTHGRSLRLTPLDDGTTKAENLGPWDGRGTRVEVTLGAGLGEDDGLLDWAEQARELAARGRRYLGRSSPWWYDSDSFFEFLRAARGRTVRDVISELDGCGHAKASGVCGTEFLGRQAESISREEALRLLQSARKLASKVAPHRLGHVGPLERFTGYSRPIRGHFQQKAARPGGEGCEIPFVVEAWAVDADEPAITFCVNRTPITAEVQVHRTSGKKGVANYYLWSDSCNLRGPFKAAKGREFSLMVNVICPYMPVTSHGKAPDLGHLESAIVKALSKACKSARKARPKRKQDEQKSIIFESIPWAVGLLRGEGGSRYSLRQLYYRIRPRLVAVLGREPLYKTFCAVITQYEDEVLEGNDLPGIYRDDRGMLYHPHTGETIPLGTRTVEKYKRPPWTFNKILYCEKEGFFPMLIDAGWPERNDCALVTSKGMATRALRDVLDLIAETEEEVWVFTFHDADGPGTIIYEKANDATKARPARKIRLINIGLEPAEALEMGLEPEPVRRKDGSAVPVAYYVEPHWKRWLQKNRVEINMMTNEEIIAFLDRKLAPYKRKVIPPEHVMAEELSMRVEEGLRETIRERILQEADYDGQVAAAMRATTPVQKSRVKHLNRVVALALGSSPGDSWRAPVASVAAKVVTSWAAKARSKKKHRRR